MPAPASSERAVWVPSSGLPYSVATRPSTVSSKVEPDRSSSDQWASRTGASARAAPGSATVTSTASAATRGWGKRGRFIVSQGDRADAPDLEPGPQVGRVGADRLVVRRLLFTSVLVLVLALLPSVAAGRTLAGTPGPDRLVVQ